MKKLLSILILFGISLSLSAQHDNLTIKGKIHYKFYRNYNGRFVPNFDTLGTPSFEGYTDCIDLEGIPEENSDHYAMIFEYDMAVKNDDDYTFRLCSDDGSLLFVDGKLLIDDNGEHGPVFKTADIRLTKGKHKIRVEYFEYHKSQSLSLYYKNSSCDFLPVGLNPDNKLPKYVKPQMKEAYKRFKAWKGKDDVVVFPIVTDVHTCNRDTYKHIGYIAGFSSVFHYDFMANLGDIGLNTEPAHSSKEYADMIIRNTLDEMRKFHGVFLFAPGNHDYDGSVEHHITAQELSDMFQKPSLPYANGNLHLTEGNCWSYYDIPEKNVRFIMLNSQNGETINSYYTFGNEQLQWLIDVLKQTPQGRDVMVMCHFMPHDIGRWFPVICRKDQTTDDFMSILSAFANKSKGNSAELQWDFTTANGTLIGLFTGDSHINNHVKEKGVNYFISQGYGRAENTTIPEGSKRAWFNSRNSLCCDIIAIKPATKEVHTFRIGAGGAALDYQFNY